MGRSTQGGARVGVEGRFPRRSFHCNWEKMKPKNGIQAGFTDATQREMRVTEERWFLRIFLDGRLERASVVYNLEPFQSVLFNLEKTLQKRYCNLQTSLNAAVQQARSGTVGHVTQVDFQCHQEDESLSA